MPNNTTTTADFDDINPTMPSDMELRAKEFHGQGVPIDKLTIRLFRRLPPPKQKAYVTTYNYADFRIEMVKDLHGGGDYIAELWVLPNSAGITGNRGAHNFDIEEARKPTQAAAPTPPPPPPPQGSSITEQLMLAMMNAQSQTQVALITALGNLNRPAVADHTPIWTALIPVIPTILDKFTKANAPGGNIMGQMREFMDFIEDRRESRDDSGGFNIKGIIETVLPMFLQRGQPQENNPGAAAQAPIQRAVLPPVQHNPPREGAQTAGTTVRNDPSVVSAATQEPQSSVAEAGNSATSAAQAEAQSNLALSLDDFLNTVLGMVRVACNAQTPNIQAYAELIADQAEAHNIDQAIIEATPMGALTELLINHAADLKMHRATIEAIEKEIRTLYEPDPATPNDADQMRMDVVPPPVVDTETTPKSPQQRAAETRARNRAAAMAAQQGGQQ